MFTINHLEKEINFKLEVFEPEINPDLCGDIDYLGYVTENTAFGIQIKLVTAKSNFGNYSVSERMKNSFQDFEDDFKGKVFIIYSLDGEIANKEVIEQIKTEIERQQKNGNK
jgi:hypothetical protein